MIIETGILISTYLGIRISEKFKGKKIVKSKPKDQKNSAGNKTEKVNPPNHRAVGLVSMGLSGVRQFVYPPLAPVSLAVFIYTAIPYMRRVEDALRKERKVNVDVLFFTADAMTLALSQYFTAAFGVWMIHEGKLAVEKAQDRSEKMLIDIFAQQPRNVWVLKDGVEIEIPLEEVEVDDILVVNTGEVIPSDGIITGGFATIDQHALTGESQPVEKGIGDQVLASTFLMTGRIYMKVEKSGQDTTIAKVGQILENSTHFKSNVQLKGEKWANKATLPMLLLSGVIFPIFGPVSTIVFINSHIGTRVRIFAPLGTLNHIALAAHKGVLIKDGRSLESLNNIDTIVFDKTGTLTHEQPVVGRIILCDSYGEEDILTYAAAAERKFSHPIAKAILQKAEECQLVLPDIEDSNYQIGYGVTVHWENKRVKVGSLRFMTTEGLSIPDSIKEVESDLYNKGSSLVFVAVNQKISGAIEIQPQVRPEVKDIISGLRQRGIKHIAIVSGDHREPTKNLAAKLGMDDYFYDILPENKAEIVEQLQEKGRSVCFIGDGINDAIAMKKANVSISLSGASSIATDMAEVVLMDGSLSRLCDLFEIAEKLDDNLQNTLMLALVPGFINLSGAFLFHFSILTAFIVNGASGIMGMKNAIRPLKEISKEDGEH
ncbi:MAG: heavy metal translocating P-type ATPase [Candidatus Electrothrix sp. LOE1_4_5]|nr:heavy metal translocating P-type ATPase [Candidatus Electrothrix gigas]